MRFIAVTHDGTFVRLQVALSKDELWIAAQAARRPSNEISLSGKVDDGAVKVELYEYAGKSPTISEALRQAVAMRERLVDALRQSEEEGEGDDGNTDNSPEARRAGGVVRADTPARAASARD